MPQKGDDDDDNDNGAGNPKKRRRKRLVKKNTMDNKGYLHTETVSVWEDIKYSKGDGNKERVDEDMGTSTSALRAGGRGGNDSKKRTELSTKITLAPPPPRRSTRKGMNTKGMNQQGGGTLGGDGEEGGVVETF